MCFTAQQIVDHITSYVEKCGGDPSTWLVGVSTDPQAKLLNHHRVKEESGDQVWMKALSSVCAHKARLRLMVHGFESRPCDGGGGCRFVK